MRALVRIVAVVVALVAGYYAYRTLFPDDEGRIRARLDRPEPETAIRLGNPFAIRPALQFALLFLVLQVLGEFFFLPFLFFVFNVLTQFHGQAARIWLVFDFLCCADSIFVEGASPITASNARHQDRLLDNDFRF